MNSGCTQGTARTYIYIFGTQRVNCVSLLHKFGCESVGINYVSTVVCVKIDVEFFW